MSKNNDKVDLNKCNGIEIEAGVESTHAIQSIEVLQTFVDQSVTSPRSINPDLSNLAGFALIPITPPNSSNVQSHPKIHVLPEGMTPVDYLATLESTPPQEFDGTIPIPDTESTESRNKPFIIGISGGGRGHMIHKIMGMVNNQHKIEPLVVEPEYLFGGTAQLKQLEEMHFTKKEDVNYMNSSREDTTYLNSGKKEYVEYLKEQMEENK